MSYDHTTMFWDKEVSASFILLITNPLFLSALFGWFAAQLVKVVIMSFKKQFSSIGSLLAAFLWRTGGMPSSHSATVTALTTAVGFTSTNGINSPLFVVTLFYGILTIRDALGVRRSAGTQAIVLNQLSRDLHQKLEINPQLVKEVHGHKTSEVLVGVCLGFIIAFAVCKIYTF